MPKVKSGKKTDPTWDDVVRNYRSQQRNPERESAKKKITVVDVAERYHPMAKAAHAAAKGAYTAGAAVGKAIKKRADKAVNREILRQGVEQRKKKRGS